MRRRAAAAVLVLAWLGALTLPGVAGADGDPASDVLLGTSVFFPYSPQVSAPLQHQLQAQTSAMARQGLPLKVALIGSPVDLGVVPDLFGHPQKYANFLDQEISYRKPQPLLVVMPAGYGGVGLPAAAQAALTKLPPPSGHSSDDLARAAIKAVSRAAEASGHSVGDGGGGGSTPTVLLVLLVVAAALIAGGLAAVTVQRRRQQLPSGSG